MKTCCPHCETVLTLTEQQLEQRNGMVRCGVCRQVFNALEHLYEEEDDYPVLSEQEHSVPTVQASKVNPIKRETPAYHATTRERQAEAVIDVKPAITPDPVYTPPVQSYTPASPQQPSVHIHLNQPVQSTQSNSNESAHTIRNESVSSQHYRGEPSLRLSNDYADSNTGDYYIGDNQRRREDHVIRSDYAEDQYDRDDRVYGDDDYEYERPRSSGSGMLWFVIVLLALLLAVGQIFYVFRNQISNTFPATRPFIMQLCGVFKCEVGVKKSVDNIAIINHHLNPEKNTTAKAGEQVLRLQATIVNKTDLPQEWPVLILKLKNQQGAVMISKNIEPKEYLTSEQVLQPLAPKAQVPINLPFKLTIQDSLSSYEVNVFYP
ncbi:zinc-ribbon and DUF3426 domain-containing protein [Pelistega sp. MC2]|uniref:zinc-ribbon and DUF3426 domain-containing protein n=1 Tax=Pelistega sp. MC2 TaxID=1720297 RepID=UPI0008DAF29A|nr:zinc-ribbon and DUF3426 domain-containing protein [Pelistega sp. MC2]